MIPKHDVEIKEGEIVLGRAVEGDQPIKGKYANTFVVVTILIYSKRDK